MSNDELILATLKDIKREMGTQSEILAQLDDAVRGPRDGTAPGLRAEVSRAHTRIDAVEDGSPQRSRLAEYGTPAATGTGAAGILYVLLEWFRGGGS